MSTSNQARNAQRREDQLEDRMGTYMYSPKDGKSMHKSLNGYFTMNNMLLQQLFYNRSSIFNEQTLLEHFNPTDDADRQIMKEFDNEYESKRAVYWYTRETCIYKILNKALRTRDINNIRPFGRLIRDIDNQLDEEHRRFIQELQMHEIKVFRGQLISKNEITRLKSGIGGYVSMNSFMSTSTNRQKALEFAISKKGSSDDLTTILLEICVNIDQLTKSYADIKRISAFPEEEEVLFTLGTVFRIDHIYYDEDLALWMATLTLCTVYDEDLKAFSSSLEQELEGYNQFIHMGLHLIENFQYAEAEKHFQLILDKNWPENEGEFAQCYYGLSQVNFKRGDYDKAIRNVNKALRYLLNSPSFIDHALVSLCYNHLGCIYTNRGDFEFAMKNFDKALSKIKKNSSKIYLSLSNLHSKMGNHQLALEYLEKSFEYFQSKNEHAAMADVYIRMAKVFSTMQQKEKAIALIDKALEYQLKDLPKQHPDFAYSYLALGSIYLDMNQYENALKHFEKADQLLCDSLPNYHNDFAESYTNFANLYLKQGDIDKALFYYEKLLDNQLKTLSSTSTLLIDTYQIIGNLYWKKSNYDRATFHFSKVLESRLEKKPSGHKTISDAYKNLGELFLEQNNWDQALCYYLKLIDNQLKRHSKPTRSCISIYQIVAKIFYTKTLLDQSLNFYYQAVDYYLQKKRSSSVEKIKEIYKFIGQIYLQKAHTSQHEYFYGKRFNNKQDMENINDLLISTPTNHTEFHIKTHHLIHCYQYFRQYLEELMKDHSNKDELVVNTLWTLAYIAFDQGAFSNALKHFYHLLHCKREATYLSDPLLININQGLAYVYFYTQSNYQSLVYFNLLVDYHKENGKSQTIVNKIYVMIGKIYLRKNHFLRRLEYLNKSIEEEVRNRTSDATSKVGIKRNTNDLLFEIRHLNQAYAHFFNLLSIPVNGDDNHDLSFNEIYMILGNLSLERRTFEDALTYFRVLLLRQHVRQSSDEKEHSALAYTHLILGNIFTEMLAFDEVLNSYHKALLIYEQMPASHAYEIDQVQKKIDYSRCQRS